MQTLLKHINIFLFALMPLLGVSQIDLTEKIPMDPKLRYGKLENGMTYYIRHNEEPKERASFYMIQNVGAVLEEDNQNGLAHFLEHMAFNGTENFEGKGIINFLEKNGVAFGRNINAYTARTQTVYNLSDVPTTKEGLVDSCLLVLHDWSNYLLLTEEEIDAERGVISEEWRTRRNSRFRLMSQYFPVLLKGSKYADRDVIGDLDVIKNFEYQTLRDFYHKWYRTDLQAIAIVGDFDVDEVEKSVKEMFSEIPPVENAPERKFYPIPPHNEDYFVLATDKETTTSTVQIMALMRNNDGQEKTLEDLKESLINTFYNSMFRQRISELLQKGTPPFISGYSAKNSFLSGYDVFVIGATAKPNEEDIALKAILAEVERVKQHGFTESELERAKANYITRLDNYYKQKDKIKNDSYINGYVNHYLNNDDVSSFDYEYEKSKQIIPTITAKDVSDAAKEWMLTKNRTIIVMGPEEGVKHLSEEEAKTIIDEVSKSEVDAYVDTDTDKSLIEDELNGSTISSEKKLDQFNAVEWTLTNGAKIVFRHADYEKDKVTIRSFSPGGSSQFPNDYVEAAEGFGSFIKTYGVGDYDAITLKKMLTGKNVNISAQLGTLTEGISGSASPKDFETMLQLIYLGFEKPRFDQEAHDAYMARFKAYVKNIANDPQKIMEDSLSLILSNHHPRVKIFNEKFLDEVKMSKIKEIYLDRFKDISDFTFIIVGNISEDTVKTMVEKYIGSVADIDRTENWKDLGIDMPEGKTERDIYVKLETPKSNVNLIYNNELEYTPQNRLGLSVIRGILDLRFTENIREKEGGTYGVSVSLGLEHYPTPEGTAKIKFDCDPERADYLKSLVYDEIDKLQKEGPSQIDLDKTVKNIHKSREQSKEHNNYWSSVLYNYYFNKVDTNDPANYEDVLDAFTVEDIQKLAQTFFSTADIVDVTFFPKEEAE